LLEVRKYKLKDICVLVRKNSEAIATVKALLENGINVISGEALLIANNPGIKLILNTLQVLAGLPANTALYKANCISLYARMQGQMPDSSHYLGLQEKTLAKLSDLLPPALCRHWQTWMQQPLPELLEKIIDAYGLSTREPYLPYLFAIRDLAGNFARQGEQGITAFLRYWEEEGLRKTLPSSENADAVQVVTIHKAKGLAFKAVMLPFCIWDISGKTNSIFWVPAAGTPYHHLQSIPLKYNKDLGNSAVAKPYFEELLFNNMDALNMLYVATTRSKEYLYISTVGKKTDTVTNIGDLLLKTLEGDISDEGSYVVDEPVEQESPEDEPSGILSLESYPTSDRLSQVFNAGLKRNEIDLLSGNNAGRMGSILHEVLAIAVDTAALDQVLDNLLSEGLFKSEERAGLKVQALAVLNNAALQELLGQSTSSLSEQTIIDAQGKSYRPDKVLISPTGVTIIDYKFTMEESSKHIEQVEHYRELLLAMGYTNVDTYLFYAVTGKLKKV
jgi:ATP-dependent helicase/nuclease subunit A